MTAETFSDWLQKHAKRPILRVVALALAIQSAYFCFLAYNRYSEQLEKIELLRESVSIGVQQSNRPLIESAILSFLSNPDVSAVLLCSGNAPQMAYPPDSHDYCRNSGSSFKKWAVRRDLIGVQEIALLVILSPASVLHPMLFWIAVSVLMTGSIFWLLMRVKRRFEVEILYPILEGLDADIPLVVKELEVLRSKNLERLRLVREKAGMEALVNLSTQVAHDIRSPLAALGAAAKGLDLPQEQRSMIDGAVARMQGIADDLLTRYRAPSAGPAKPKTSVLVLAGLVEQVVAEKRLQHKDKPGVSIDFAAGAAEIKASVEPTEFQRLVSNLINNSVEAFSGPGTVSVALSALDHKVLLTVKDNGKGIPPEILARLGQKGETHGKAGGTGLGVYHARKTVESWGGSFKIESESGKGTAVTLELPAAAAKTVSARAVLLDDDLLVHMNWRMAAKAAGVEFKAYKIPGEIIADAEALPKDTPIYIDSELGGDVKGEDTAQALHEKGFTDLTMATGHGPEKFSHLPWLKVTGKEPPWN
ncbi:MAG: hypothetical protein A2X31_00480 [Elusimicrobia bacterium GWB2_63_22]|nr:MAG: hypothetical protein A2X31_00480 [Elusimicrobia bacterium GWB2_63_22]